MAVDLVDIIVWGQLMAISFGIGIYFNIKDSIQRDIKNKFNDYILARKELHIIPVVSSITTSFLSSVTLIGAPSSFYQYGISFFLIMIGMCWLTVPCVFISSPIFAELTIITTYEYIGMRFNNVARVLGASSFIISMLLYMSMVLYSPCVAMEELLGMNAYVPMVGTAFLCVAYTIMGGLKAVVWSDVFFIFLTLTGPILIVGDILFLQGGIAKIWRVSVKTGRLRIVFGFNNHENGSLLSLAIGGGVVYFGLFATNQIIVQRVLALKEKRLSRAIFIASPIIYAVFLFFLMVTSAIIANRYIACDPVDDGRIKSYELLIGLYVSDNFTYQKGIAGIFIAALYGAGLSTLSSGFHSMATVTVNDIVIQFKKNLTDVQRVRLVQLFIAIYGLTALMVAIILSGTKLVLFIAFMSLGIYSGPNLALFLMAMALPFVNRIGAIVGFTISNIVIYAVFLLQMIAAIPSTKRVSSRGDCIASDEWIESQNETVSTYTPFQSLLATTKYWEAFIGVLVGICIGALVSVVTEDQVDSKVESRLIAPVIRPYFMSYIKANQPSVILMNSRDEVSRTDRSEPSTKKSKGEEGGRKKEKGSSVVKAGSEKASKKKKAKKRSTKKNKSSAPIESAREDDDEEKEDPDSF